MNGVIILNNILASLYNCAMSTGPDAYLMKDDIQNLHGAIRGKENLEQQLQELLDEKQLALLERYLDQSSDVSGWEYISVFRKGLAMGLKLGTYGLLQR